MTFSATQQRAALALASGSSAAEAAAECSCCERTVRRWLLLPGFKERVQEIRGELFALAVGKLSALAGHAAATLGELLDADIDGVRLQAARSVLEHGVKIREATDIEARLAALERRHAQWRKS
jgi:hypothetical protein